MRLIFVLFILCTSYSVSVFSDDHTKSGLPQPEALIASMGVALREQNYSGQFAYEHGTKLETFQIYHFIENDNEYEGLFRLTGREQEFVRAGATASCGTIGGRLLSGSSISSGNGQYFGLDRYYRASLLGRDRVAGRLVWVVQLAPLDEYRFGLTMAIDQETHLLMRYVVYDARKKIGLERMQFVSFSSGDIDRPDLDAETKLQFELAPQRCVGNTYSPEGHSPWKPQWLPPGFILIGYSHSQEDGHMETYTDGLSSFSVFVKRSSDTPVSQGRVQQSVSARGAVMALLSTFPIEKESLQVTIIGEIPLPAAQKISLSMHKISTEKAGS